MDCVIRPARVEDVALIADWTKDTFIWGDYVAEMLPTWLDDPDSLTMVCALEDDVPVAMSRVQMLSPTEAWLSAARVHPEHRRTGLGSAMNEHGVAWARSRGVVVVRLAIEETNTAAMSQVSKLGYHRSAPWIHAEIAVTPGQRLDSGDRLKPALAIDADAAWTFWAQSELALAGRELIADGWRWKRAHRDDLDRALERHSLLQATSGWAIVDDRGDSLMIGWLAVAMTDAPVMAQCLVDLGRERRAGQVEAMAPALPWLVEALVREGFEVQPMLIFSKPL